MNRLLDLDILALRDRLADGSIRAAELAAACLERIAAREPEVGAFAWFDAEAVRAQAAHRDAEREAGRPPRPLHGLPVAIKDTIDTVGIPTKNGTPIDAGRVPSEDALVVGRLKAAGAVIAGKAVTSELALFTPGKTHNPRDPARSPGGSSSGSAAAVAAGMVPLAVGTQTAGSVIRPAAYCGVVGFKPTFGLIPRTGILRQAPSLDTVGVFAASPEGVALLADTLIGDDGADPSTRGISPARLTDAVLRPLEQPPRLAFVPPFEWHLADGEMRELFEALVQRLGPAVCDTAALPASFAEANRDRERIQLAELSWALADYERRGRELLSPGMQAAFDEGKAITAREYLVALERREAYYAALEAILARCDAILTAAAPGPAPLMGSTGSPIFNGLWTYCGTPAVTLPLLATASGLPVGVQLIGRRGADGELLRVASWLMRQFA